MVCLGFREEDDRGKFTFSSHHIKGTLNIPDHCNVDPGVLSGVFTVKLLPFPPPFLLCTLEGST